MKIKNIISFIVLLLIQFSVSGQRIGFDKIDDLKVSAWKAELVTEYQNVYHFGDSDLESDLIIIISSGKCYAQIKSGSWSDNGEYWYMNYENLTSVRIEGNRFFSDKTNGEFVIYDNGEEKIKGLKVYKSWSGITDVDEYEIGIKSYPTADYYPGLYQQASLRQLNHDELSKMTKQELKIMRNEIFARYGYKFKTGGEMELYFKNQDWYNGQYENIDKFLTDLEKENIGLIQQTENE